MDVLSDVDWVMGVAAEVWRGVGLGWVEWAAEWAHSCPVALLRGGRLRGGVARGLAGWAGGLDWGLGGWAFVGAFEGREGVEGRHGRAGWEAGRAGFVWVVYRVGARMQGILGGDMV